MWILAVVLAILLVALLILCVPVDLIVHVEKQEHLRWRFRGEWLFGVVGKDFSGKQDRTETKKKKRKKPKTKRLLGSIKNLKFGSALLETRGLPGRFFNYGKDILKLVRFRELTLDLRVGTGDPADTGLLIGALTLPARCVNLRSAKCDVRVHPDFDHTIFRGHLGMSARVFPIQIIGRSVVFFASPSTCRLLWAIWRARRR